MQEPTSEQREFLEAFHNRALQKFGHAEHVQLAWTILQHHELAEAEQIIKDGIQEFAEDQGASSKYHETLTLFWTRIIHHSIQTAPNTQNLRSLLKRFPFLSDSRLALQHWSEATLWGTPAREGWVEPDKAPLPF